MFRWMGMIIRLLKNNTSITLDILYKDHLFLLSLFYFYSLKIYVISQIVYE